MKVLLTTGLYPPEIGGPATYSKLLADELPERGVEVVVLPFSTVRHLPRGIRHVMYFLRCVRAARQCDVIFAQDTVSVGFPSVLAARVIGKKFLVRVPGDYAWEQARQRYGVKDSIDTFQTKKYAWQIEQLRQMQQFVVRNATRVIVPSEYLKKMVRGWVHDPTSVVRVYNGIELPVAYEEPAIRPSGFLVITIGRMVPWKGMEELVRIVAKEPAWQLVFVGDGPERQRLESRVQQLGITSRVHFMGELPRAQALGWARVSDVFVLNSDYEGLSHVLVEVASLGVPVLASSAGGNAEVVGDSGVYAKEDGVLHSALKHVQADPTSAHLQAVRLQEKVQQFSIVVTLNELCSLLEVI